MNYQILKSFSLLFILASFSGITYGQNFEDIVKRAWKNNDQLAAHHFQLQSAQHLLQEAKSMYGPNVQLGMQYTLASGGRSIQFPVGDLLNPVYSTLNVLTQTNTFPTIENVNEQFLPNNFYDARLRITQPIYYPDLAINKQAKSENIVLKNLEIRAFKRSIAKEVMSAYFTKESANKVIDIYSVSDSLLVEAKRVTQSLIKNGMALPTALSRIETQQSILLASKIEAEGNKNNALVYLNFIVGDTLVEEINLPDLPDPESTPDLVREEILQIEQGMKIQNLSISREEKFYHPKIGVQLDLGSQDFDFGFEPYLLMGLNFEMNLFDSKKHSHKKSAAKAEISALESQKEWATNQFEVQKSISKQNLESAINQAKTFQIRIHTVQKIYKEVLSKYKEGNANYLELLDAQTQVTNIQIQYTLSRQNAWLKWAEYVYASASFPIE